MPTGFATRTWNRLLNVLGGVYSLVAPTLTDQDAWPLQLDVNGNLKVNVAAGSGGTPLTAAAEQTAQAATFQYFAATPGLVLASVTVEESTGAAGAQGEIRLGTLNTSPVACYFALGPNQEKSFVFAVNFDASAGIRVLIDSGSINVDVGTHT